MNNQDIVHTRLVAGKGVDTLATEAAKRAADAGGSPRAQMDAARANHSGRLTYIPHQGMRERMRNLKRLEKA